jgi:DNA adenine methylase
MTPKTISAINYFGGKKPMLKWLLPVLDIEHNHFIDLFGGSGAILLNKKPSNLETYNDINGDVVNLFRVLRDPEKGEQLIRALELTPYSKEEYNSAWDIESMDPVERARCFFVRSMQSYGASGAQASYNGWSFTKSDYRNGVSQSVARYLSTIKGLSFVIYRLRGVQVENRDFREIIDRYSTSRGLLVYLDPPYPKDSRTGSIRYNFEFSNTDHIDLFELLKDAKFKWCLSSYESDLMENLYGGGGFYKTISTPFRTNDVKRKRIEVLWTNYNPCINHRLFD